MSWRIDFTGGKDPVMTTSWFIWDRNSPPHHCTADLLTRNGPL